MIYVLHYIFVIVILFKLILIIVNQNLFQVNLYSYLELNTNFIIEP